MKVNTIYLQLALCFMVNAAYAQLPVLWGATQGAGLNSIGTIYKINADGTGDTVVHDFDFATGGQARAAMILGADGKFYGTGFAHGQLQSGVIYSFDPRTRTYTDVYDFNYMSTPGGQPYAKIMQATNGLLYGTNTQSSGNAGGVFYSYNIATDVFTSIYTCNSLQNFVYQGPMQASNGKIYGVILPSISCYGGIYCFNPATNAFNIYQLSADSNCINGRDTESDLIEGEPGVLYGTSFTGGNNGLGVIFGFNTQTNTFTKLYSFDGFNGYRPDIAALIAGHDGKVYGTTLAGGDHDGGVIFSLDTITHAYTKLFDFDDTLAFYPDGPLLLASDGKIYGSTKSGGNPSDPSGVIYSFDRTTHQVQVIKNIGSDSRFGYPKGGFIEYGTTKSPSAIQTLADNNFEFRMTPNPAAATVTIYLDESVADRTLILRDIAGKLLATAAIVTDRYEMPTEALANGLYFVSIGKQTRKLAINK